MGLGGWIALGVLALALIYAIAVYNGLVRLRALVREGFSGITVQLRRRADLIPNLVSTVEGYATHEKSVLSEVTAHRADATSAKSVEETAQADRAMSAMIGRLIAVAEAYPDLKANANFQQLASELSDLENKIAASRRFFNNAVQEYNTGIQQLPAALFAGMFGFTRKEFFDLGASRTEVEAVPTVKF